MIHIFQDGNFAVQYFLSPLICNSAWALLGTLAHINSSAFNVRYLVLAALI